MREELRQMQRRRLSCRDRGRKSLMPGSREEETRGYGDITREEEEEERWAAGQ